MLAFSGVQNILCCAFVFFFHILISEYSLDNQGRVSACCVLLSSLVCYPYLFVINFFFSKPNLPNGTIPGINVYIDLIYVDQIAKISTNFVNSVV